LLADAALADAGELLETGAELELELELEQADATARIGTSKRGAHLTLDNCLTGVELTEFMAASANKPIAAW
jgi:hypothetical protein